jgi:ribosomal protein S30
MGVNQLSNTEHLDERISRAGFEGYTRDVGKLSAKLVPTKAGRVLKVTPVIVGKLSAKLVPTKAGRVLKVTPVMWENFRLNPPLQNLK